jgi:hypothetical protein
MFADLKKQLGDVETRLKSVVAGARAQVTSLKKDVDTIDEEFLSAFDRFTAVVKKTEQSVKQEIGAVEKTIQNLAPPK